MKKSIKILLMMIFAFTSVFMVGCNKDEQDNIEPVYNMAEYRINHFYEDVNGYYSSSDTIVEVLTGRVGTTITAELKNKDFYTFKSSSSSITGEIKEDLEETIGNEELSLYLYYQRDVFVISLVDTYKNNAQISAAWGVGVTLPTRTDTVKTFVGWAYDEAGQSMATITEMPTSNITLYAIWQ